MKMNTVFICALIVIYANIINAQNVGINNSDPKAKLDVAGDLALRGIIDTILVGVDYAYDVNSIKSSKSPFKI